MTVEEDNRLRVIRSFIRSERLRRNITQEEIGQGLAISQNTYNQIEIGYTELTLDVLIYLAELFNMRLVDLLNIQRLSFVLKNREIEVKIKN